MKIFSAALAFVTLALPLTAQVDANGILWPPRDHPELKPSIAQDITVSPGDYIVDPASNIPSCGDQRDTKVADAAAALSTALIARAYPALSALAPVGGLLVGQTVIKIQSEVGKTGGSLSQLVFQIGASPRYASCGTAALVVPQLFHISKILVFAKENDPDNQFNFSNCAQLSGQHRVCDIGWSAWTVEQRGNAVVGVFKNWSADRTRMARLYVEFERN